MMTGKDVEKYISDHTVICYNYKKNKVDDMISVRDAWDLILRVVSDINDDLYNDGEELKVSSNAES